MIDGESYFKLISIDIEIDNGFEIFILVFRSTDSCLRENITLKMYSEQFETANMQVGKIYQININDFKECDGEEDDS
ncbi:MAG: hypothetical protein PVG30_02310 [Gammaproteobacteria bacterium]|jgi:hypothetical protein